MSTLRDLMPDEEFDALTAAHGPSYPCWEVFGRWLDAWRAAHPHDDRDDLELVNVYADWPDDAEIGEPRP